MTHDANNKATVLTSGFIAILVGVAARPVQSPQGHRATVPDEPKPLSIGAHQGHHGFGGIWGGQDGDGYSNVEGYLNGTGSTMFVDYTKPENNVNTLK